MLEVVCLEELALAELIALHLKCIDTLISQSLRVRLCHVLCICERLLLTEVLALELGIHREAAQSHCESLVCHCLKHHCWACT